MSDAYEIVTTTVSYLEMVAAPGGEPVAAPGAGVTVTRFERPTVARYRALYCGVGEGYDWTDRVLMDDVQLASILEDPRVEVWVLRLDGEVAGYVELDRRVETEVEIAYFGLLPAFYGRRLGSFLLDWAIRRAWSYGISRLWVHTCTLDHPRALPTYQAAGFRVYATRDEQVRRLPS